MYKKTNLTSTPILHYIAPMLCFLNVLAISSPATLLHHGLLQVVVAGRAHCDLLVGPLQAVDVDGGREHNYGQGLFDDELEWGAKGGAPASVGGGGGDV